MINVLQVGKYYPPYRGGMETHLADLCQELKDRVNLEVLVSHTKTKTEVDIVDDVEVTRLGTPARLMRNPISPALISRIRKSKADIVHLHWPNPIALLAYMASGSKAKLVVTYQSDIIRQKLTGALFQPILERALSKALIIATSPNYVKSSPILTKFKDNCRVVPMGIDPRRINNVNWSKVREFKQLYGERMVLTTGRFVYYKGFQHLIQAMKHVNGHLVIAGDGPMNVQLRNQSRELGINHKVSFAGQVSGEDLNALYAASSIFALPSVERSEAFGLVQLEAMAAGKPVVNTSLDSGVPFVSLHEQTGLTVEPANPEKLATGLNTLLDSDWLRGRYGAAAKQRVHETFTLERMGDKTYDIYLEALGLPTKKVVKISSAA